MTSTMPSLTIGIEEEYQIVDPSTLELCSGAQRFLDREEAIRPAQMHPEFLQSQIEISIPVCRDIQEARRALVRARRAMRDLARQEGMLLAAAGTHPFSSWAAQTVSSLGAYPSLSRSLQDVGRRLLIFGLHIHVGIEDHDLLIDVLNRVRYFLPYLLALSASSPFWHGRDTGFSSYRSVLFGDLPRTGIPPVFDSYAAYRRYVSLLLATNCIAAPTHIWWDVRPSEKFPTLEVRVPDMGTRVEETLCIAALTQAIVAKLVRLRQAGQYGPVYPKPLLDENKWRAMRYGCAARLVAFDRGKEVPFPTLAEELLRWLDDVVDELGSRREVEYVQEILRAGTSAARQRAVYRRTGSLRAVVERIIEESEEGL